MKTLDRTDKAVDLSADYTSAPVHLESMEGYSICLSWTDDSGTLDGSFKLQASNNAFKPASNDLDPDAVWADITGSTVAVTDAGTQVWNTAAAYYKAVRYVWTWTAGAGTLTAYITAKGIQ